jgi:hypothetical protein
MQSYVIGTQNSSHLARVYPTHPGCYASTHPPTALAGFYRLLVRIYKVLFASYGTRRRRSALGPPSVRNIYATPFQRRFIKPGSETASDQPHERAPASTGASSWPSRHGLVMRRSRPVTYSVPHSIGIENVVLNKWRRSRRRSRPSCMGIAYGSPPAPCHKGRTGASAELGEPLCLPGPGTSVIGG